MNWMKQVKKLESRLQEATKTSIAIIHVNECISDDNERCTGFSVSMPHIIKKPGVQAVYTPWYSIKQDDDEAWMDVEKDIIKLYNCFYK